MMNRDATIPIRVNSNSRIGRNWLELELELVGIGRNWNWNWSELVGIGLELELELVGIGWNWSELVWNLYRIGSKSIQNWLKLIVQLIILD